MRRFELGRCPGEEEVEDEAVRDDIADCGGLSQVIYRLKEERPEGAEDTVGPAQLRGSIVEGSYGQLHLGEIRRQSHFTTFTQRTQ